MDQGIFILLFRGINVGGNKLVRMETLRAALEGAGLRDVKTYIQSGNVVLTSEGDEATLAALVESTFAQAFGFASRPTVRTAAEWDRVIAGNPFAGASDADGRRVHAVFLDATPRVEAVKELRALAGSEQIEVARGVLYLYTPDGFGQSKVAASLDKVLKVPLTARNWNTVLKLRGMAEALRRARASG